MGHPQTRRARIVASTALLSGLLGAAVAGCGAATEVDPGEPERAAVAANARAELDCETSAYRTGAGDYVDGGLETVQDDAAGAVESLLEENYVGEVPTDGYAVVRADGDRALVAYSVEDRPKVAFVVEDGVTDWDGNEGWGVSSYAMCDPAELPAEVTAAAGIGVWTDADGDRVPVVRVRSYDGPEHCDWQDIVFLTVGPERRGQQYLRDVEGELSSLETTSYAEVARVPAEAVDTGWRREGRELWTVPDDSAAFLVSLDDPTDVERWPGTTEPAACG